MLKISDFWQSIRMSWLRRLPFTRATWGKLHQEDTGSSTFCLMKSNFKSLEAARKKITNPVWSKIYAALIKCRRNILNVFPEEYVTFFINGKPDLTANYTGI